MSRRPRWPTNWQAESEAALGLSAHKSTFHDNFRGAPGAGAAIALVARDFGVSAGAIMARARGTRRTVLARQVAAYLCCVGLDLSPWRVAAILGRHHTIIDDAIRTLEDSRDDGSAFDAWMDGLTARLNA